MKEGRKGWKEVGKDGKEGGKEEGGRRQVARWAYGNKGVDVEKKGGMYRRR